MLAPKCNAPVSPELGIFDADEAMFSVQVTSSDAAGLPEPPYCTILRAVGEGSGR